jgi:Zn-dependent membrane protease YugP
MIFSPFYFLFALPALLFGFYAQFKVRQAYAKYLRLSNRSQVTGRDAARRLLDANGLDQVEVQETRGTLTDHYDPRTKALYLSKNVAEVPSVASLGIVAHEVGHATQDAQGYVPLKVRSAIVPMVTVGSWVGPVLFLVGMLLQSATLPIIGLALFSLTLVFALVTLPVELDASRRAVAMLQQNRLVANFDEEQGVRQVLSAAALTYVAAAAQALSTILYYLFLLTGGRRRS